MKISNCLKACFRVSRRAVSRHMLQTSVRSIDHCLSSFQQQQYRPQLRQYDAMRATHVRRRASTRFQYYLFYEVPFPHIIHMISIYFFLPVASTLRCPGRAKPSDHR